MDSEIKIKHNKFIFINKNPDESDKLYEFRKKIIISKDIKNEEEFNNIIILSNYCSNIKYLECKYNEKIMKEYNNINKNIYDNY